MTRDERRRRTKNKQIQREQMIDDFGLNGGLLYERHQEKIKNSSGYMRDGNVSHYVQVGRNPKTKTKDAYASYGHKGGYGKATNYSKHDQNQLNDMNDQINEE